MPWQRQVADVALEVDGRGRLVYREVRLTVPRQSGKTSLLLAVMVHRALGFGGRQRITYTAQTRNDARQKLFDDHIPLLEGARQLRGMWSVRATNGSEAIRWANGSHHGLTATMRKSGHGSTIDLGVIDEAFAQADSRTEQAMKPAMVTRPQAQLWVVSTAGEDPDSSPYLWGKVESGRRLVDEGSTRGVAYFEWSCPEDQDPFDPAGWWGFMPALGHTIEAEAIEADAQSMERDEFLRAYANWWVRRVDTVDALPGWAGCADAKSQVTGGVAFAVDAAPDSLSASIAVAGRREDGAAHVEVVENHLGTAWVVPRLVELRDAWGPVAVSVAAQSPAGALLPELAAAGFRARPDGGILDVVSTGDHAKACGMLAELVKNRQVHHRGQMVLDGAVVGAVRRRYGDGAWLWSRQSSSVDISPLVAATLALWGVVTAPEVKVSTPWSAWT